MKTIEDGVHTFDIFKEGNSKKLVGTQEFADEVIVRLGQVPSTLKPMTYTSDKKIEIPVYSRNGGLKKDLVGVDVFVDWKGENPNDLAEKLLNFDSNELKLEMITNRGVKVWPEGFSETFCTDHWRCRFSSQGGKTVDRSEIVKLLSSAGSGMFISVGVTDPCGESTYWGGVFSDGRPAAGASTGIQVFDDFSRGGRSLVGLLDWFTIRLDISKEEVSLWVWDRAPAI